MIELLTKLSKDAKVHLWTLKNFAMNPASELKSLGMDHETLFISLGEAYIMYEKLVSSISKIQNIQKYCEAEMTGFFYDYYIKKWEDFSDYDTEYTPDTVYKYILGEWDMLPSPEIDHTIIAFVEVNSDIKTRMTEGILKHFPDAGPFKKNDLGEMEKVTLLDCQINNNLKAGSLLAAIQDYNERLAKIKEIATNKGTLGEILNLISR